MSTVIYLGSACIALLVAQCVRRFSVTTAAVLVLLPLLFTGRALLKGNIYGPVDLAYTQEPLASMAASAHVRQVSNPSISDVYSQFFPWNEAVRRSVHRGQWPLWNPYELCGTPLAAAAQSAPYHPITLFGLLVPRTQYSAYAASMLFLFAAISAFLLCFELTGSLLPALTGAAAWMASTHLVFFAGTALANTVSVLPLLLLAARRIVHDPARRAVLLLIVALVLVVLSGHPESTLHGVALAIAYFLFELFGYVRANRPVDRRPIDAILGSGVMAGIVALLLCAVFLLPMIEAIRQSEEYLHRATGGFGRSSTLPQMLHRLTPTFFPFLEGAPGVEERRHAESLRHGWLPTAYAGSLLFAPAAYALFRSRSREKWFFAGAIAFGLGAGISAPGITHLLGVLPGFNFAVNDRMISLAVIGLCVLAAIGLADWLEETRGRSLVPWFLGAACVIVFVALMTSAAFAPDFVRLGAAREVLPLILGAAAIMVLPRPKAAVVLLALLLIQRGGEASWLQPTVSKRAFYPSFDGLQLMRDAQPFRVAALGSMLPPAIATHYGLEDVRGFQAMTFARFRATYPLWSIPQPVWSNRIDRLDSPFLSLMNVRYAIVPPAVALPAGWLLRQQFPAYAVVENTHALPRAFVPRSVTVVAGEAESGKAVMAIRDYAAEGVVESKGAHAAAINGPGIVTVRDEGARLFIRAVMDAPGWVIVSNCGWKGWRARSAGKPLHVVPGDHAFVAFHLPAGQHDVELFYRPRSFVTGAVISAITLLLVLLYALMPSSAITFFMSAQTSFFAAGFRSR